MKKVKKLLVLIFALALLLPSCGIHPNESADSLGAPGEAASAALSETTTVAAEAALSLYMPPMPSPAAGTNVAIQAGTAIAAGAGTAPYTAAAAPTSPVTQKSTTTTTTTAVTKSAAGSSPSSTGSTGSPTKTTTTGTTATTTTTRPSTTSTTTTATTTTTTTAQPAATVRFEIDGSAAVGYGYNVFLPARDMALISGDSVLDLLNRSGAAVEASGSGAYVYVRGINGLREKDCGGSSGWIYEVNGDKPPISCGRYQPKNGDVIVWKYTLSV